MKMLRNIGIINSPGAGACDLTSANQSHEKRCIEIDCSGLVNILKPKKLMLEYFSQGDYEWAYFRIVTDNLPGTNVYENLSYNHKVLTELSPGNYVEPSVWDDNEFNGENPYLQVLDLSGGFQRGTS